jgi:hypothetical protein
MVLAMFAKINVFSWLAMCVIALTGCEDNISLENVQDRTTVTLDGTFLTESPDDITYPVKVLFAIDMSLSMGTSVDGESIGSDPDGLRLEAAEEFIEEYNTYEDTSFEIILWSGSILDCTEESSNDCGFTKDPDEISRVIDGAANETVTDYYGALDAIQSDIYDDMYNSDDSDNLARSKYIVLFLSDGLANDGQEDQSSSTIIQQVSDIVEMAEDAGVGSFSFHTFFLDDYLADYDDPTDDDDDYSNAYELLEDMAVAGGGTFTLFESADSIDFIDIVDVRLTTEYEVKYLVAYNFNTIPGTELIYADSDADGITNDDEEDIYGTDPLDYDSDDDGLGDYVEISMSTPSYSFDPLDDSDTTCSSYTYVDGEWPDTDSDGLNDCEETLLGSSRYTIDTDNDGMPDVVEFLAGTNLLDDDTGDDSDFDGREDWQEVMEHTNVNANDPNLADYYAYEYYIYDEGLVEIDQGTDEVSYQREYSYTVSNIDIVDTLIAGRYAEVTDSGMSAGDNLIRFYIAQVPEDFPDTDPVFRVAEFYINVDDDEDDLNSSSLTFELLE